MEDFLEGPAWRVLEAIDAGLRSEFERKEWVEYQDSLSSEEVVLVFEISSGKIEVSS